MCLFLGGTSDVVEKCADIGRPKILLSEGSSLWLAKPSPCLVSPATASR